MKNWNLMKNWRSSLKIIWIKIFCRELCMRLLFQDLFWRFSWSSFLKKIFFKSHFEDLFLKISLIKTSCYIVEQFSYCTFGFTIPKGIARKLNFLELPLFPHIQRLTLPLWVRGPFHLSNFTTFYHFFYKKAMLLL